MEEINVLLQGNNVEEPNPGLQGNQASVSVAREQNVNPCSVTGEVGEDGTVKPINYNKLVEQFGTEIIDDALRERFERVAERISHDLGSKLLRHVVVLRPRCGEYSSPNRRII
ncbi:hypothetical protein V492_07687 [Pseudogymnoascus sp. VKM F-4246]|nr:hypothetical protein V492_07687 [Pseudogymnoascus sp. VKM F-4246]